MLFFCVPLARFVHLFLLTCQMVQQINKGVYGHRAGHIPLAQRCQLFARELMKRLQIDILGLTPLASADRECPSPQEFQHAFELLRVRNRFGCQNPIGGYRDVNLKLRIGFTVPFVLFLLFRIDCSNALSKTTSSFFPMHECCRVISNLHIRFFAQCEL